MRILSVSVLLGLFLLPFVSVASEKPVSGAALFSDASLGTSGKSCSTCHPQGKGLEQIGDYDDAVLQEFVNFCIRDAMKGEMLPEGSAELRIFAEYLRTVQKN